LLAAQATVTTLAVDFEQTKSACQTCLAVLHTAVNNKMTGSA
jgi:hypothetical protein